MTSPVKSVRVTETVDNCLRIMTDLRIRHLPVLEGDKVVGMISVGDLVKAQLNEKESLINDLESYISGSPSVRPPAM
jgi:predicted transcriptional regulator